MKRKKKWLYGLLLALLIGLVLFLYNAFNGNPLSHYLSERALQQYITQHYPNHQLRIDKGYYNFKFSQYEFEVIEIGGRPGNEGPATYPFSVRGFLLPEVVSDGIRYSNLDTALMERLKGEAEEELFSILTPRIPTLADISVHLEVVKGQLAADVRWDRHLKLDDPIFIHIVLNANRLSREDVLAAAIDIQEALQSERYVYSTVNINANMMDGDKMKAPLGYVKYAAGFGPDDELSLRRIKEMQ